LLFYPDQGGMALRACPFSDLRDKLRRMGLRPTRQRVSLGWLLSGKGDRHITAEMLYEEAARACMRQKGSADGGDKSPCRC
jgi:Fur family transcriptional regulator, iron response regulator